MRWDAYVFGMTPGSSFSQLWDPGPVTSCSESQFLPLQNGHNSADLTGSYGD